MFFTIKTFSNKLWTNFDLSLRQLHVLGAWFSNVCRSLFTHMWNIICRRTTSPQATTCRILRVAPSCIQERILHIACGLIRDAGLLKFLVIIKTTLIVIQVWNFDWRIFSVYGHGTWLSSREMLTHMETSCHRVLMS